MISIYNGELYIKHEIKHISFDNLRFNQTISWECIIISIKDIAPLSQRYYRYTVHVRCDSHLYFRLK